jgi:uncharacterized protein (TIGR03083 family)
MTDTSTGRRPWERPRDRTGWLPFDAYLRLLRADCARMREVAELGLDVPVPSCPGWSVANAVAHSGEVYAHKVACTRLQAEPDPWPPPEHADRQPLELFDASLEELLAVFDSTGPDAPSHTWWPPDQSVGFWMRRMALETAVHRVDVELAHAVPTPVDAELAVDGIDELLVMMLAGDEWAEQGTDVPVDATVRITCQGQSWTVQADADAVLVDRSADGDADAEVAGEPSELFLWLWGRADASSLVMTGDSAAVSDLRGRLVEATG